MSIKIQTKKPVIPIELGELKFEFEVSDNAVSKFRSDATAIKKELDQLDLDTEDIEEIKNVLKKGFDLFLGDGAFNKVYQVTPSVIISMQYFTQIVEGLAEELEKMGYNSDKIAKKYLQK